MKDLIFASQSATLQDGETAGKDFRTNQHLPFPKVVVSDQAKGLIASLPTTFRNTTLQLYN
jgi:hypothetical protein